VITIKKKHSITDKYFLDLLDQYNNVIRFSYNRIIKDGITKQSDLEHVVKDTMSNIDCLDASWIKCAVKQATDLQRDKKMYFGGKNNFFKRKYNKIESYDKNSPIEMRGSCNDKGNRKADLVDNKFIFKPKKGVKFEIDMILSKKEAKMLSIIEEESKLGKNYFNFKIDKEHVYISFEEPVLCIGIFLSSNRYLPSSFLVVSLSIARTYPTLDHRTILCWLSRNHRIPSWIIHCCI